MSREFAEMQEKAFYKDLLCLDTGLDENGNYPNEPLESDTA